MKKKSLLALFSVILLFSCKKDYTCTCGAEGQTQETKFTGLKKNQVSDYRTDCEELSCTWSQD